MIDGTVAASNDYNLTVIFAASSPKANTLHRSELAEFLHLDAFLQDRPETFITLPCRRPW